MKFNRFTTLLVTLLLSMALMGASCTTSDTVTYTVKTADLVTALDELDNMFQPTRQRVESLPVWNTEELELVKESFSDLSEFRNSVADILSGEIGPEIVLSLDQVVNGYDVAKATYINLKDLVTDHSTELSALDRAHLRKVDVQASRLDSSISFLTTMPKGSSVDVTQMIKDIVTIAAAGAKLALIL